MRTDQKNALGPTINLIDHRMASQHPKAEEPVDYAEVEGIVERYCALKASEALVLILQDVQRRHHYIPEPAMRLIGERMGLPMVQIYGVASFYQDFSMQPRAAFAINICEGTSCYCRGSDRLRAAVKQRLGIEFGEQTPDGRFGVERADYCYGCCQLGPVVEVNHRFYRDMTPEKLAALIDELERAEPAAHGTGHDQATQTSTQVE